MSHYARLKVSQDAPVEVIRAAYRVLAAKYHPDRQQGAEGASSGESHDEMVALNTAYQVLINPESRREYDALLAERRALKKSKAFARTAAKEAAEADQASSNSRVDMQWSPAKAQAQQSGHPLMTRRMMFLGGSFTGVVVGALVIAVWQMMAQHQMDQALSDQYAVQPTVTVPPEVAVAPADPIRTLPPKRAAKASGKGSNQTVDDALDVPAEPKNAMPSLANMSKMSNEELVQILPRPNLVAPGAAGRRRSERQHHPLDGQPLNLRQDGQLIEAVSGDVLR